MPTPDIESRLLYLSEIVEVIIDKLGPASIQEAHTARRDQRIKDRVTQLENSWAEGIKTGDAVKVKKVGPKSMVFGLHVGGSPMCGPFSGLEPVLQKALKGKSVGTKVSVGKGVSIVITAAYEPVEKPESK